MEQQNNKNKFDMPQQDNNNIIIIKIKYFI